MSATGAGSPGSSHSALHVDSVSKRFGRTQALEDVQMHVGAGSLTVLLGPAGAGKTTTLRLIAGLDRPDSGRILLHGKDLGTSQPKDRDIAMIFDNLALYPNKTGYDNIANPLLIRRGTRNDVDAAVKAMAGTLRIMGVLDRLPKTMSGGERQRVALGRALVRKPGLFLLDEPLSSLDAMLRIELRAELRRLQSEHGHSFLFATPDYAEALAVADSVVVLRGGRVVQVADPQSLYDAPDDRDTARFVGSPEINILPARRQPDTPDAIHVAGGAIVLPPRLRAAGVECDRGLEVGLRPEHLNIVEPATAALRGVLVDIEPLGVKSAVTLRNDEGEIRALAATTLARGLKLGEAIGVAAMTDHLMLFDRGTGRRL